MSLDGFELSSLTACPELFALCVAASVVAAVLALAIPKEGSGAG